MFAIDEGKDFVSLDGLNFHVPNWIISDKWQAADLHGKSVEFEFTARDSKNFMRGQGWFFVLEHKNSIKLAIQIDAPGNTIYLTKEMADLIERHPSKTIEFRCAGVVEGFELKD